MPSNHFGQYFQITTFGESHGPAVGVVIDGCPAGLTIDKAQIEQALQRRRPGNTPWTSQRKERDKVQILSGVYERQSTGAPICLLIPCEDAKRGDYETIQSLLRPGHAGYTYLCKYGVYDPFGGGRASARETAARVAAGAVATQLLHSCGIRFFAHLKKVGSIQSPENSLEKMCRNASKSPIFCSDEQTEARMIELLQRVQSQKDSIGGVVEAFAWNVPCGLGDPVYQKLPAKLAFGMLSIPACKGFEMGEGFDAAKQQGSEHNDSFHCNEGQVSLATNHAGGALGGISTGLPLVCKVAFKPTSSIKIPQKTVDIHGKSAVLQFPDSTRHDPCLAIRAVPVVKAMLALVLADCLLADRLSRVAEKSKTLV